MAPLTAGIDDHRRTNERMMSDLLVSTDRVSKKFCRKLRRSLWYGLVDLGGEIVGRNKGRDRLRREEFWAVQDVSFELKRGETIGLIGPNGSGKTTLLRMLNGLIRPDAGRIEVRGCMQALIALGAGFNPVLTGRENIYVNAAVLGFTSSDVKRKFDDIVDFSGVGDFIDTPLQSYSSGMAVRLGFAVSAHLDPEILLVDEVLAVGDHGFQFKCLNKIGELKKKGTGIIMVSHNMHTILVYTNRVALMHHGKIRLFDNVNEGVSTYKSFFQKNGTDSIEKICNGNSYIRFTDISIPKRKLSPGDGFDIILNYESTMDYPDVEIDVLIYSSKEQGLYFQATNKSYEKRIDILKSRNKLSISIQEIRINNASATIVIVVWTKNRLEQLFWWRVPVEFGGMNYAGGNNFLNVRFETPG
jgi:lipopolysaccharide transport system ATP-binding protein